MARRFLTPVRIAAAALVAAATFAPSRAEDPEEFRRRIEQEYEEFSGEVNKSFSTFRERVNSEYADFMERPWKEARPSEPLRRPAEPKPGPAIAKDDDPAPRPSTDPIKADTPRPYSAPDTRPQPIGPIDRSPIDRTIATATLNFYGTPVEYPAVDLSDIKLAGSKPKDFASAWRKLSANRLDPLIASCIDTRQKLGLSDWHFFRAVDRISSRIAGKDTNLATLLTGYILSQAGYDIRFAVETETGSLRMLFSTTGTIYGLSRYHSGDQWYYPYNTDRSATITMCDIAMPGTQPMSLAIDRSPSLAFAPAEKRTVSVHGYPSLTLSVTPNRNLIELLADYPEAGAARDVMSRWTTYAQTPASPQIVREVYPALRKAVEGKNQYQAVALLLKVAQSFPYGYDDKIWGRERIFFMDESWNYPYSDCEDHAINFTRMVRDILGLETALLHYPGHIAAAVAITDGSSRGDCVTARGSSHRYTVCDPTYFYVSPGATAPNYRATAPTLIPLH